LKFTFLHALRFAKHLEISGFWLDKRGNKTLAVKPLPFGDPPRGEVLKCPSGYTQEAGRG